MENKTRALKTVAIVVSVPAMLSMAGCVTASSTTALLSQQTQQNRGLLALEQANTRALTSQKASLQSQLASLTRRETQIVAQGDSGDQSELRKVREEIAMLRKSVNALD
jgi:hypothetical protein